MAATPSQKTGTARADLVGGDVLRIRFTGHVDGRAIESVLSGVRAILNKKPQGVIFDTCGVTSVDPNLRAAALTLLKELRAAGVRAAKAAANSSGVRMMGAAIAFGAGLPIEFFSTYDEALARMKDPVPSRR